MDSTDSADNADNVGNADKADKAESTVGDLGDLGDIRERLARVRSARGIAEGVIQEWNRKKRGTPLTPLSLHLLDLVAEALLEAETKTVKDLALSGGPRRPSTLQFNGIPLYGAGPICSVCQLPGAFYTRRSDGKAFHRTCIPNPSSENQKE